MLEQCDDEVSATDRMYAIAHNSKMLRVSFNETSAIVAHWRSRGLTMFLMAFDVDSPQPLLQCSVCRTAVAFAVDGMIVYPRDMDAGKIRRVLLAHTKTCLDAAEAQFQDDGGGPCLMPLEEYLAHFSSPARVRPMKPLVAAF